MNGIRFDLIFQGEAPQISLPCIVRMPEPSIVVCIGKDTPMLRAKVTDILLAYPETQVIASPCLLAKVDEFQNAHELVRVAFDGVAPDPLSFNVKEAAKRLGVGYSQIRRLVRLGYIRKIRGRISSAELNRYLKERQAR